MATKKQTPIPQAQIPNFILESLAAIIGTVLSEALSTALQGVYVKNKKVFTSTKIKAMLSILNVLVEATAQSNTKIDDAAVSSLINAIKKLAETNKIKI